jgi:hypothetical protein
MKKALVLSCLIVALGAMIGCSGGPDTSPAAQKDLRDRFAKAKFDIKDVPQNQRAMVQGFIDRENAAVAAGKSAGSGH